MADKYCMYLRKSRKDDESYRGESIEETLSRHQKILTDLAASKGIIISEDAIYREVVSGDSIDLRPQMQRLLSDVENELWKGVFVVEVERLARGDTSDQGRVARSFKYSETLIITPNKTFDPTNEADEEYFEFGLFMSRRELKTITRRLQRGRLAAVKEGLYVANKPPYGYDRIKLEKQKGWTLTQNPEQAKIVKLIFDLYTTGEVQPDGTAKRLGVNLITNRLNHLQIPNKNGKPWVASSIRDILINPVYIGMVRWNWRPAVKKIRSGEIVTERPRAKDNSWVVVQGRHEAIISPEIFDKAQAYMKLNPARPISERGVVKNPLAGIIICGICGRRMIRRPYKTGYPDTLMCAVKDCTNVSTALDIVENRLLAALKEWLGAYKLQWQTATKPKKSKNSALDIARQNLVKLESEIKTLKEQQSNLDDLLERGIYTDEKYRERTIILENRIKQTENDRNDLIVAIDIEEQREEARIITIPAVEYLLDVYNALPTPQAKNDMLKEVLEKVVYTKTKSGRWHNAVDDFELELYPKLPRPNH